MKEFVCICCPRGCLLKVDDNENVTGNFCIKGKEYALNEIKDPKRNITSFIPVINKEETMVSVKTNNPIPKDKIFAVMEEINKQSVKAPCHIGDIVIKDVLHLGVDIIITKNIE